MEHFKDRSEQLLVLNLTASEGWTKLCPFPGEQIPVIEREKLRWRKNFWRMYRNFRRQAKQPMKGSTGNLRLSVAMGCDNVLIGPFYGSRTRIEQEINGVLKQFRAARVQNVDAMGSAIAV
jgi:hypothetical protein